ncbi:uncharacterized protein [Ptychodera flava]|uniref:uncharacterized protein isoform X8 n=1 Tax=Ptychodera flava TaxID=63121 RepID=UPI00396A05EA
MAFVVVLQGGSPWGFRLIGGKEFGVPLRIAKINPGSKAAKASIEVGDIVYSINGQSTDELEHNDALSLVKSSKDSIELHLRRTTSPLSPITNTSTIYRSTSNGPTEDSSEEQSEDMTETTTKTVMMNSDQGSIADYEDSLIRAGLGDVDLQNLPSNVAVVKKTTTKVTKITRCTSPARWSSSESLTSTEGDRKRERQQPPITVQVSSAAEPGSDSPKLLHVWSPPLSGGEASPVSPPFPTNSHLQVPEQVQQTATKSDVTKLIKEIDSRPPHPPPRHSGPDVKRAYYTDQSAVASPPTRRKKVKTTLFIRPRSNSFDATTSRSWTPVNFKTVSKDDNERTLTSPPPTVPPPPQMYEYYPVITQGPKTVKTSLILQPEANRRRARDRRAFTPLARSTSVPPQLDFINGTHATNRVRGEDMFALRKRQHKMWDKRDMTDESAAVPKINPAAVPQNTYTDPTSPPTTTTLDSLPLPSPPPPLTMSDNAEVVTNHEPLEPVKVNANPISPKPGVWTPGQPSSTISTDSFNKDRDANFNVAPVWKPFGGDMPKKEFKAVKLELNSDKPKETEPEEKDIPPPPPPPPMPSESYAWRPPTPPAKEEPPAPEAPKPAEPPSPQNKGFTKYQPNGPTSSGLPSTVSPTITLLQHNRDEDTPPRPPSPPPQYGGGLLCTPSDPPKGGNETEEPAPSPPPETNTPAESPPVSSQPPTELVCQGSKEPSPVRALPMREVTPVRSPPPGEMTPVWSPPAMEFRTVTAPPASNPIAPIPTVSSQSVDSDLPPSRPNLPDEMTACTPQPSSQEMIPPVHSLPRHMIKPVHPPPRDMTRTVNQFPKDETLETYPVPGTVAPTEHPPSGLPTPTVHTASQELPQGTEQQPSTYTEYQQPRTMTPIEHPPPKAMEHPPPRTEAFIVHPPPRETPAPTYYQMPRVTTPVNYQPPREVTPTEQPQPQNIIPIEHSQPIEITPTENPPPRPMAPLSYPTPREVTLNQYQPTTEMTPIPDPPRRVMTPISAQPMRVMTPVKYQDSEEAFPQRPSPPRGMISPPPRIMSPVASSPPAKFFTPATPPPRDMTSQPVRYQPFEEPAPPRPLPPAEIVTAPPRAMQPPATPPPRGVLHAATPPPRSMAPPATPPPRDMVPPSTPPPRHMTPMATPPPRDMIPPATPPPREMVPPATPPHRGMMPPATPPPRETGPVRRVPGGYHQLQRATASSNFPTEIILTPPTPREVQPPARPAPPQQTTPFGGHPRVHTNPLPSPPPPREMTPTQQPQPYSQIHPQQRPPPTQGAPTVIYQRPPTPQGMPPTVQNPPPREDLAHGWRPTEDQAKIANTNLYVVTDPKDHHIKETIKTHEIEGETVLKDKVIYAEPNFQVVTDANQLPPGAVYQTKTVEGDVIHTDTYYPVKVPGSTETTRRVVRQSGKYEGIGPVDTESGMPIGLRSGVQEDKRHDWYKEMYKSIHRQEKKDDENPYRPTYIFPDDKVDRTQKEYNPYRPTYVFPEGNAEPPVEVTEKDVSPTRKAGQQWAIPSARNTIERYQQQPRSITDYEPGKSSLAAKEKSTTAHMHNPPLEKTERAKSPPYISGSRTLPASYRRSDQVSPRQTQSQLYPDTRHQSPPAHSPPVISHDLYKNIQKGGDIPIHGLRKPEDEQDITGCHLATLTFEPKSHRGVQVPNLSNSLKGGHWETEFLAMSEQDASYDSNLLSVHDMTCHYEAQSQGKHLSNKSGKKFSFMRACMQEFDGSNQRSDDYSVENEKQGFRPWIRPELLVEMRPEDHQDQLISQDERALHSQAHHQISDSHVCDDCIEIQEIFGKKNRMSKSGKNVEVQTLVTGKVAPCAMKCSKILVEPNWDYREHPVIGGSKTEGDDFQSSGKIPAIKENISEVNKTNVEKSDPGYTNFTAEIVFPKAVFRKPKPVMGGSPMYSNANHGVDDEEEFYYNRQPRYPERDESRENLRTQPRPSTYGREEPQQRASMLQDRYQDDGNFYLDRGERDDGHERDSHGIDWDRQQHGFYEPPVSHLESGYESIEQGDRDPQRLSEHWEGSEFRRAVPKDMRREERRSRDDFYIEPYSDRPNASNYIPSSRRAMSQEDLSQIASRAGTGVVKSPAFDQQSYYAYADRIYHASRRSRKYIDLKDFYAKIDYILELRHQKKTKSFVRKYMPSEYSIRQFNDALAYYEELEAIAHEGDPLLDPNRVARIRWQRDKDTGLIQRERDAEDLYQHFSELERGLKTEPNIDRAYILRRRRTSGASDLQLRYYDVGDLYRYYSELEEQASGPPNSRSEPFEFFHAGQVSNLHRYYEDIEQHLDERLRYKLSHMPAELHHQEAQVGLIHDKYEEMEDFAKAGIDTMRPHKARKVPLVDPNYFNQIRHAPHAKPSEKVPLVDPSSMRHTPYTDIITSKTKMSPTAGLGKSSIDAAIDWSEVQKRTPVQEPILKAERPYRAGEVSATIPDSYRNRYGNHEPSRYDKAMGRERSSRSPTRPSLREPVKPSSADRYKPKYSPQIDKPASPQRQESPSRSLHESVHERISPKIDDRFGKKDERVQSPESADNKHVRATPNHFPTREDRYLRERTPSPSVQLPENERAKETNQSQPDDFNREKLVSPQTALSYGRPDRFGRNEYERPSSVPSQREGYDKRGKGHPVQVSTQTLMPERPRDLNVPSRSADNTFNRSAMSPPSRQTNSRPERPNYLPDYKIPSRGSSGPGSRVYGNRNEPYKVPEKMPNKYSREPQKTECTPRRIFSPPSRFDAKRESPEKSYAYAPRTDAGRESHDPKYASDDKTFYKRKGGKLDDHERPINDEDSRRPSETLSGGRNVTRASDQPIGKRSTFSPSRQESHRLNSPANLSNKDYGEYAPESQRPVYRGVSKPSEDRYQQGRSVQRHEPRYLDKDLTDKDLYGFRGQFLRAKQTAEENLKLTTPEMEEAKRRKRQQQTYGRARPKSDSFPKESPAGYKPARPLSDSFGTQTLPAESYRYGDDPKSISPEYPHQDGSPPPQMCTHSTQTEDDLLIDQVPFNHRSDAAKRYDIPKSPDRLSSANRESSPQDKRGRYSPPKGATSTPPSYSDSRRQATPQFSRLDRGTAPVVGTYRREITPDINRGGKEPVRDQRGTIPLAVQDSRGTSTAPTAERDRKSTSPTRRESRERTPIAERDSRRTTPLSGQTARESTPLGGQDNKGKTPTAERYGKGSMGTPLAGRDAKDNIPVNKIDSKDMAPLKETGTKDKPTVKGTDGRALDDPVKPGQKIVYTYDVYMIKPADDEQVKETTTTPKYAFKLKDKEIIDKSTSTPTDIKKKYGFDEYETYAEYKQKHFLDKGETDSESQSSGLVTAAHETSDYDSVSRVKEPSLTAADSPASTEQQKGMIIDKERYANITGIPYGSSSVIGKKQPTNSQMDGKEQHAIKPQTQDTLDVAYAHGKDRSSRDTSPFSLNDVTSGSSSPYSHKGPSSSGTSSPYRPYSIEEGKLSDGSVPNDDDMENKQRSVKELKQHFLEMQEQSKYGGESSSAWKSRLTEDKKDPHERNRQQQNTDYRVTTLKTESFHANSSDATAKDTFSGPFTTTKNGAMSPGHSIGGPRSLSQDIPDQSNKQQVKKATRGPPTRSASVDAIQQHANKQASDFGKLQKWDVTQKLDQIADKDERQVASVHSPDGKLPTVQSDHSRSSSRDFNPKPKPYTPTSYSPVSVTPIRDQISPKPDSQVRDFNPKPKPFKPMAANHVHNPTLSGASSSSDATVVEKKIGGNIERRENNVDILILDENRPSEDASIIDTLSSIENLNISQQDIDYTSTDPQASVTELKSKYESMSVDARLRAKQLVYVTGTVSSPDLRATGGQRHDQQPFSYTNLKAPVAELRDLRKHQHSSNEIETDHNGLARHHSYPYIAEDKENIGGNSGPPGHAIDEIRVKVVKGKQRSLGVRDCP